MHFRSILKILYFWKVDLVHKISKYIPTKAGAFKNHRPGQKLPQAKHKGLAWPGLARLPASGRSWHITKDYFWRHFIARSIGLIIIPLFIYLPFLLCPFRPPFPVRPRWRFHEPRLWETLTGNFEWNVTQQRFVISRRFKQSFYWLSYPDLHYYDTITLHHKLEEIDRKSVV